MMTVEVVIAPDGAVSVPVAVGAYCGPEQFWGVMAPLARALAPGDPAVRATMAAQRRLERALGALVEGGQGDGDR